MLNIPNTLTLLRILAVPVFLSLLVDGTYGAALIIFFAAGVTDAVDGAIARLTDTRTELGAHLDPLADKLLLVSSFIALAVLEAIPLQLMITVIVRDTIILGGFITTAVVVGQSMEMAPSIWGKLTTFLQLLTVCTVLLGLAEVFVLPPAGRGMLFGATALASFVSGAGYMLEGIRWYQQRTAEPSDSTPVK